MAGEARVRSGDMGGENAHLGDHYLEMLGLGHLGDYEIPGRPGHTLRDFLDFCDAADPGASMARDTLAGIEAVGVDHPAVAPTLGWIRQHVAQLVGGDVNPPVQG